MNGRLYSEDVIRYRSIVQRIIMSNNINKVAVIGTGVIGAGWIIRCLAHNKKVVAFDKDFKLKKKLIDEIKRTWPYVKKLFNKKKFNLKNFKYVTSIEDALERS